MKKVVTLILAVALLCTGFASAMAADFAGNDLIPVVDGVGQVMAGSATTAGWSYLYMSAAAQVVNKYNPDINITAQITTGGGENLMRIAAYDMSMGVAQATYINDWYNGNEEQGVAPNPHLRTLYAGPFSIFTPIVRTNSPYQTLADLKGQKISVDSKGGSSQYMNQIIFNALGMGGDFFNQQYLTCAESKDGMITGTIEGYIGSCADPHAATSEIFNMVGGCRVLKLSQEEIDTVVAANPAIKACVRPAGTYKGIDEDQNTFGACYQIICTEDFPEEYAYEIAKTLYEHYDEWCDTFSGAIGSTGEQTINTAVAPLHDGVARYFKEIGMMD